MEINNKDAGKAIDKVADVVKEKVNNTGNEDQTFKVQIDQYDGVTVIGLYEETNPYDSDMIKQHDLLHREVIVTKDVETVVESILDNKK